MIQTSLCRVRRLLPLAGLLLGVLSGPVFVAPVHASSDIWSAVNTGQASALTLAGVTCRNDSFCKAVGSGSQILSWNGLSWTLEAAPVSGVFLTGVSCPSATLCKAVGWNGNIFSWNGTTWSSEASGTTTNLNAVSCPSTSFCKAVGDSGSVVTWNGSSWTAGTLETTRAYFGVSCPTTTMCKAVGSGVWSSWNGSAWSTDLVGDINTVTPLGVSCPSASMCWSVGIGGRISQWTPSVNWGTENSHPTTNDLYGVDCPSSTRCKAVGTGGVIVSWSGGVWSTDTSPTANNLLGTSCSPLSNACLAVGSQFTVLSTNLAPTRTPTITSTRTITQTPTLTATATSTYTSQPPSQAGPDFLVNSAADTDDGVCDRLGVGSGNQDCTLREAIQAANAQSGANTITFGISNATITLTSGLPALNDDVTISGSGRAITVSGAHAYRPFVVNGGKNVTLDELTITQGNCYFACDGGGIHNSGTLTVTNSTFSGNNADYYRGGAIYSVGTLRVSNSTFSSNSAIWGGGIGSEAGVVSVTNSTFFGNCGGYEPGPYGRGGGGIYSNRSSLYLTNNTFSGNTDAMGCGAGSTGHGSALYAAIWGDQTYVLNNNIFNGGQGANCQITTTLNVTNNHNLSSDGSCGTAIVTTSANLNLGALADNGGPTKTLALGSGSTAIDAGDGAVCAAAPVNNRDQRGNIRPAGVQCDVGAVEFGSVPAPTATATPTPSPSPSPTPTRAGGCPAVPAPTCFAAGKSSIALKHDASDPSKNKLTWKWSKGVVAQTPASATFGDPLNGSTNYRLCIYDQRADVPIFVVGAAIDAGSTCLDKPCWDGSAEKGWKYKHKTGNASGITGLQLKGGEAGKPSLKITGKGSLLALPASASADQYFDQDTQVIVQLQGSNPANCWEADYDATQTSTNDGIQFKAKAP